MGDRTLSWMRGLDLSHREDTYAVRSLWKGELSDTPWGSTAVVIVRSEFSRSRSFLDVLYGVCEDWLMPRCSLPWRSQDQVPQAPGLDLVLPWWVPVVGFSRWLLTPVSGDAQHRVALSSARRFACPRGVQGTAVVWLD